MGLTEDDLVETLTGIIRGGRFISAEAGDTVLLTGYIASAVEDGGEHYLTRPSTTKAYNESQDSATGESALGTAEDRAREAFDSLPGPLIPSDITELTTFLIRAEVVEFMDEHPDPNVIDIDALDPTEPTENYLRIANVEVLDSNTVDAESSRLN